MDPTEPAPALLLILNQIPNVNQKRYRYRNFKALRFTFICNVGISTARYLYPTEETALYRYISFLLTLMKKKKYEVFKQLP
jgi:hypothetical protein